MNGQLGVHALRFAYGRGAQELFDGFTHDFEPGAVTALTGPSGRVSRRCCTSWGCS